MCFSRIQKKTFLQTLQISFGYKCHLNINVKEKQFHCYLIILVCWYVASKKISLYHF